MRSENIVVDSFIMSMINYKIYSILFDNFKFGMPQISLKVEVTLIYLY